MWFPDESPKIPHSRFKVGQKVIYTDKEDIQHIGKILQVIYKGLGAGYRYSVELEEPYNNATKYIISEYKLRKITANDKA